MPVRGEYTEDENLEVQKAVARDWLLYGEIHITNAPNGLDVTFINPTRIKYEVPKDPTGVS